MYADNGVSFSQESFILGYQNWHSFQKDMGGLELIDILLKN